MGEGSTAYELKILQVKSLHVVQDYSKGHLLVQTHNRSHTTGLAARRISVFGHITRLESDVPTHMALRRHIDLSVGRPPSPNWRRRPDRPRTRYTRFDRTRAVHQWISGGVLSTVAVLLEQRNGPRRLRDIDDEDMSV